jgi:hypothetical protein
MRLLSELEYRTEAESSLRKCFLNDDPRKPEFGVNAEAKKLFYEYHLPDSDIINSIVQTASESGETGFYLSILIRNIQDQEAHNHWWIPFDEVPIYLSVNTDIFQFAYQLENVIYSPSGSWALMRSFENFGLLVGKQDLIQDVCLNLPGVEQQIFDFLNYVREGRDTWGYGKIDIHWIPQFLSRIYGEQIAQEMLRESRLAN